jgi:TonB family protein
MNILVDAIFRSSIVLAAGLVATWTLRRQPAALRHWVLATALLLAAAQPLMAPLIPSWTLPSIEWAAEPLPEVETRFVVEPLVSPRDLPAPPVPTDWTRVALMVWLAGAVVSIGVLVSGVLWLSWLGWRAKEAGSNWRSAQDEVRAALGIRRPVRLLVTTHPAMLVTWGARAPVILLPAESVSWSADRIRLVLLHEIAHLARRDWLIQLAAELMRAINWFNPLFWIACAQLRRDSEYACDDIVLECGVGGTSYASHLLDLARAFSVHGRTWLPAPSIARPSTLERRVRAMLNPQVNRRPVSLARRVALAALLVAVALPVAAASQASSPHGTVSDPMGRPLSDATLRLSAVENIEQLFETKTDAEGAFVFPPVPAGEYMMSVRYPGFNASRQRMQLSGSGTTIELQVQVGTLRETVTVGTKPGPREVYERQPTSTLQACDANAGGQLTPPVKIKSVNPRYKPEWREAKLEGVILMNARIGADGKVRQVDVISPVNAELEDEAIAAVSQWEFTPTYLNCQPVAVQMYVTVMFTADR